VTALYAHMPDSVLVAAAFPSASVPQAVKTAAVLRHNPAALPRIQAEVVLAAFLVGTVASAASAASFWSGEPAAGSRAPDLST
jgi:hypothetical protein